MVTYYIVPLEVSEELRIVVLQSGGQMLELERHGGASGGKVVLQSLHQGAEGDVGVRFTGHHEENGAGHVTHSLVRFDSVNLPDFGQRDKLKIKDHRSVDTKEKAYGHVSMHIHALGKCIA